MKKKRQPVNRWKFNSKSFEANLARAAEEAMKDPEYLKEIAAWDVCSGDGLTDNEEK